MAGYLLVLLAAVMWGLLGPVSKYIFEQGISPMECGFWRAALAWIFFGGQALIQGRARVEPRHLSAVLGFGVCGVALLFGSYQFAIKNSGAALASILLYTAPAWVALLSWRLLRESMSPVKVAAVAMTLAGVVGVSLGPDAVSLSGSASFSTLGILCGLLSGFSYALYYIFGKLFLDRYATPTLFLYALPVGALAMLPFVTFAPKNLGAWAGLFTLALCSTYGAYSVYYAGLRRLEATRAAVVATLEPVVAATLAFFWWDERFGPAGYVGSALILGSVVIIVLDGRRRARAARETGAGQEKIEAGA